MYTCNLCNNNFKNGCAFSKHLHYKHNVSAKDYYDTYMKKPDEGICPMCGKETPFQKFVKGYQKHCCAKCAQNDINNYFKNNNPQYNPESKLKIQQTCQEKYNGNSPLANDSVRQKRNETMLRKYGKENLVYSLAEKSIITNIKQIYTGEIKENSKSIIKPLELDIYLTDLKLAIEYNGIYWHSIQRLNDKDYHLNKSLMCRKKGIRLIHIYEFEDLDEQINLLKNIILGEDKYPKDDFNKNNLISTIPKSILLFDDGRLQVYGAGELK